eukprot:SAG31_NODE_623_length_13492_cov_62.118196_5_plen_142_part_00
MSYIVLNLVRTGTRTAVLNLVHVGSYGETGVLADLQIFKNSVAEPHTAVDRGFRILHLVLNLVFRLVNESMTDGTATVLNLNCLLPLNLFHNSGQVKYSYKSFFLSFGKLTCTQDRTLIHHYQFTYGLRRLLPDLMLVTRG